VPEFSKLNKLIDNCSWVLAFLYGLEDQRLLKVVESNFRKIVKKQLQELLEAKRIYWKHRSTIYWVKFGDENTKLLQAMATYSFRRNAMSSFLNIDSVTLIALSRLVFFGIPSKNDWEFQSSLRFIWI
jgi:CMP-2-keto-3-deoxyoctulosonic acid synthetase